MKELLVIAMLIIGGIGGSVLLDSYQGDYMEVAEWDVGGEVIETSWLAGTNGEQEFLMRHPNAKPLNRRYEKFFQPVETH